MRDFLRQADETPVTMLTVLAYVTLALLTGAFEPDSEKLRAYGMLVPVLVSGGEPWRLIAHAFLHGGIVHLVFNLMMLLGIGPALERSLGSLRFALLYLVSAVGGGVAACLLYDPRQPMLGGSGALFGMLGAALAINVRSGRHPLAFLEYEGPRRLVAMIVANLVIGWILPMVSNTAHIGGLVSGFCVALLFLVPARTASATLRHWRVASAALFASALFASLVPVTRFDWLWDRGVRAQAPGEKRALLRAAAMAFFGTTRAEDTDIARMHAELFEESPTVPDPDPPPRGR